MSLKEANNLVDLYRTFRSVDELYIDTLSKGKPDTKQYIKSIIDLLYSDSTIGFYSGVQLWNKIFELSKTNDPTTSELQQRVILQKLIRIYLYQGKRDNNATVTTTEQQIFDFYKPLRPSTFYAPKNINDSKYELVTHIGKMIEKGQGPQSLGQGLTSIVPDIMMIAIDTPAIDFKKRNCDKVEFFLNSFPSIMISQVVPYVDVKFITKRKIDDVDGRIIDYMSPLKFLFGAEEDRSLNSNNSANSLMYDSQVVGSGIIDVNGAKINVQDKITGMEMFTMPQTLLNLNYDQNANPRYNPIINSTVPFGAITDISIISVPSYKIFSYKTASIKLKIFDRSRLSEIADFLNPQLYSATTIQLTYGLRAPQQILLSDESLDRNGYHEFINNNMLKSELYGIKNSSVTIDNSGIASISLDLFMKSVREFNDVTPNGKSIQYYKKTSELNSAFAELVQLAKELKLLRVYNTQQDIRGSIVISSAKEGSFPDIEAQELKKEIDGIKNSLIQLRSSNSDPKIQAKIDDFNNKLQDIYALTPKKKKGEKQKYKQQEILDKLAEEIIKNRLEPLKPQSGITNDIFAYTKNDKFKDDNSDVKEPNHPSRNFKGILGSNLKEKALYNNIYGGFGSVSFGRLFFTYFSSAIKGIVDDQGNRIIDEYQVLFYSLNANAGQVANLNIIEFPIDMQALEKAYTDRVIKQGGEKITLMNFLEIVRETQFDDIRHPAFGFSDLYEEKQGEVVLKEGKVDYGQQLLQRNLTINKKSTGEPFTQPVIDFYVESSVENLNQNSIDDHKIRTYDLLSQIEKTSSSATPTLNNTGGRLKRITRIHIYDKAATPHAAVSEILKSVAGAGYLKKNGKFKDSRNEDTIMKLFEDMEAETYAAILKSNKDQTADVDLTKRGTATTKNISKLYVEKINSQISTQSENVQFSYVSFRDDAGRPRFDLVKKAIAEYVPSLKIGSQGSTITNVSYSTQQDAALATIMMLRDKSDALANPVKPNGSGIADLPLRIIPGQLSLTTMGCPIIEYMQQFFVDLGTGTTIDNLYNVIGLTHSITPGKFVTDLKFGFADAYGTYEGAREIADQAAALSNQIFLNVYNNFGSASSTSQNNKPNPAATNPTTGGTNGSTSGATGGATGTSGTPVPSATPAGKANPAVGSNPFAKAPAPSAPTGNFPVGPTRLDNFYMSVEYESSIDGQNYTTRPGEQMSDKVGGKDVGMTPGANDPVPPKTETP